MRHLRHLPFAALLGAGLAAPAVAAEDLGTLLGKLQGPPSGGSVKVLSWVERGGSAGDEFVVTLIPEGGSKLLTDPGVVVTPVTRAGIAWTPPAPASRI